MELQDVQQQRHHAEMNAQALETENRTLNQRLADLDEHVKCAFALFFKAKVLLWTVV